MGGEPLLNPEVGEYVKLSRKLYPSAQIKIVTNAILLPKMPDEFFDTLKENNVGIDISFYPPLESKMPAIKKLLENQNLSYKLSPLIKNFFVDQTLKPTQSANASFFKCDRNNCNNLYDGKIGACNLPFTTKYFNAYYDENLPVGNAVNLYDKTMNDYRKNKNIFVDAF